MTIIINNKASTTVPLMPLNSTQQSANSSASRGNAAPQPINSLYNLELGTLRRLLVLKSKLSILIGSKSSDGLKIHERLLHMQDIFCFC